MQGAPKAFSTKVAGSFNSSSSTGSNKTTAAKTARRVAFKKAAAGAGAGAGSYLPAPVDKVAGSRRAAPKKAAKQLTVPPA
jgi:hypothetical protein